MSNGIDITSFVCIFKSELDKDLKAHVEKMKGGLINKKHNKRAACACQKCAGKAKDQNELVSESAVPSPGTPTHRVSLSSLSEKARLEAKRNERREKSWIEAATAWGRQRGCQMTEGKQTI